jgi:hypothetical protein
MEPAPTIPAPDTSPAQRRKMVSLRSVMIVAAAVAVAAIVAIVLVLRGGGTTTIHRAQID